MGLFVGTVLYVLWCGFVCGPRAVGVVVWFCLWTVCFMFCSVVLFVQSVLSVLWSSLFCG